jgi:hypothetical protein
MLGALWKPGSCGFRSFDRSSVVRLVVPAAGKPSMVEISRFLIAHAAAASVVFYQRDRGPSAAAGQRRRHRADQGHVRSDRAE